MGVRVVVAIVLGLVTLIVRYRRQRNRLVKVIIREGGLYVALTSGNSLFLFGMGESLLNTHFKS